MHRGQEWLLIKIVKNILSGSHPREHPRLSEETLCLLLFSGWEVLRLLNHITLSSRQVFEDLSSSIRPVDDDSICLIGRAQTKVQQGVIARHETPRCRYGSH